VSISRLLQRAREVDCSRLPGYRPTHAGGPLGKIPKNVSTAENTPRPMGQLPGPTGARSELGAPQGGPSDSGTSKRPGPEGPRRPPEMHGIAYSEADGPMPATGSQRFWLLDGIRSLQATPRQRSCRRKRISAEVQLVELEDGRKRLDGICRCGSVTCPACAAGIYARRAEDIQSACERWRLSGSSLGQQVVMLTLTVRHSLGDDVTLATRGLHQAFRRMRQGRRGQALWRQLGIVHSVRATEATYGENGWHMHLHVLLFVAGWDWLSCREKVRIAWQDAVEAELGSAFVPDETHGVSLSTSTADRYIAKLGLEVMAITKKAKAGNLTPWQVAHRAANGESRYRHLWSSYARAMLGRQTLAWSAHAKDALGVRRARDELLVMQEEDRFGVIQVLATWEGEAWDTSKRVDRYWTWKVLAGIADLPKEPTRRGVTLPMRETYPDGCKHPPRLPKPARVEPMPDLAKAQERHEADLEAELFPERRWYLRKRAMGKVRAFIDSLNLPKVG
jgi:hypothetical protein